MLFTSFIVCVFGLLISSTEAAPSVKKAIAQCDSAACKLPDCLCMNTTAPIGLKAEEIPQLVFLTFDDAIFDSTQQKGIECLRNPLTLEELKVNDIFGCATPVDPAPCEQPLTCSYGQTVMKTCNSPCPSDYPWLQ